MYIYAFSNKISTYLIHLHNKVQKQERNHYEFINSSYLLMGLPGLAYLTGLCDVGWTEMPEVFQDIYPWLIHIMLRQEMHRIMVSLLWKCFTIVDWKNGTKRKGTWWILVWWRKIDTKRTWIILESHIKEDKLKARDGGKAVAIRWEYSKRFVLWHLKMSMMNRF